MGRIKGSRNENCRVIVAPGDRFGKLTVIKEMPPDRLPCGQINRLFLCRCDCGNEKPVRLVHLRHNRIRSCGCLSGESHGMTDSRLYRIWRGMHDRCSGTSNGKYYHNKGITICKEWDESFTCFMDWAVSNGYSDELQIDRIDGDGNYTPDNCRWVTPRENRLNAGGKIVAYYGENYYFTELIERLDLLPHISAIRTRIKRGYSVEDAIDKPIRNGNYKRVIKGGN